MCPLLLSVSRIRHLLLWYYTTLRLNLCVPGLSKYASHTHTHTHTHTDLEEAIFTSPPPTFGEMETDLDEMMPTPSAPPLYPVLPTLSPETPTTGMNVYIVQSRT